MTIAEYRNSLGMTQEAFAVAMGLKSKGYLSDIEKANRASPEVALAIEAHSSGLIDAADLNATVALVRSGVSQAAAA